jgi:hypothetical protein
MSRRLSRQEWDQLRTAFAAGAGLRELARNMEVSENTVLSRARREKWSAQIEAAKALHSTDSNALTPLHSATITMQQRAERYTDRMAGVSEKVLPHLESMQPGAILDSARNIEQFDRVARRNFGLDDRPPSGGILNLAVLTNQAAIQISAVGK